MLPPLCILSSGAQIVLCVITLVTELKFQDFLASNKILELIKLFGNLVSGTLSSGRLNSSYFAVALVVWSPVVHRNRNFFWKRPPWLLALVDWSGIISRRPGDNSCFFVKVQEFFRRINITELVHTRNFRIPKDVEYKQLSSYFLKPRITKFRKYPPLN